MNWNAKNNLLFSILVNLVLFAAFLVLFKPILNSDDDFYVLYTLGGGYGNASSHILHYLNVWHPFLFWPVAKLFSFFPHFNWYALLLIVLQFTSCVYLLYILGLLFGNIKMTGIVFVIFFLFFESRFLISLNNSNSSFVLAISGCTGLLVYFIRNKNSKKYIIRQLALPLALLLIGLLLRVHTTVLYIVLTVCAAFSLLPWSQFKRLVAAFLLWGAVSLIFNIVHKIYYHSIIPEFEVEEERRQLLFQLANHPIKDTLNDIGLARVKNSFIQSWFLYDREFIKPGEIKAYFNKTVYNRVENPEELPSFLYWTFINSRVYILLFALVFLFFIVTKARHELKKWLFMLLPFVLAYLYLSLFMKVTEGIFIALLAGAFLSAVLCLKNINIRARQLQFTFCFLLILNIIWMVVRVVKTHYLNANNITETRSILKEIKANQNLLFINTNYFNDNGFYIWDTPLEYPLHNFINKELLITNSYQTTLDRFNIKQLMKEIPLRKDVVLSGQELPLLKEYYKRKGLNVSIDKKEGFRNIQVFEVRISHN